MRNELLSIIFVVAPGVALADTYVCAADAGAFVEDGANRPATSALANVAHDKYVVARLGDSWVVKVLGSDYFLFDKCVVSDSGEPSFCEHAGEMFSGSFILRKDGNFSVLWMTQVDGRDRWIVAKGRCSKF
jgi:hypothetical protein